MKHQIDFHAIYQNAANKAHHSALRAKAHPKNGFYAMAARIDARAEYLARQAYLATCPNSHAYLCR